MQHVAGVRDRHHPAVGDVRETAPHRGEAVGGAFAFRMIVEPAWNVRVRGRDPQRRRRDVAPDRVGLLDPVHRRERQPVPRVGGEANPPVRQRLRPMSGEKDGLVARQPRIALLQTIRDGVEGGVGREVLRVGERVEPFRHLVRRGGRLLGAHAESVERDHATRAPRAHAGVVQHHVAAEAVPGDVRRLAWRECLEQRFEVGDVVREPVTLRLPGGFPVAAQIRRDHVPISGEGIDQKLERRRDIHPAVKQKELRRGGLAPRQHVRVETAQRDAVRAEGSQTSCAAGNARGAGARSGGIGIVISCGRARGRPASRSDSCRRRRNAPHPSAPDRSPTRNRRRSPGDRATETPTG